MLRTVIEKTPNEELYALEYSNPSWQIACHAIWGARFYWFLPVSGQISRLYKIP